MNKLEAADDETALQQAEKEFENWAKANNLKNTSLIPRSLYHGTLHSVLWNGKKGNLETSKTGKPELNLKKNNPDHDIIIANSGFDALVTLLTKRVNKDAGDKVASLL